MGGNIGAENRFNHLSQLLKQIEEEVINLQKPWTNHAVPCPLCGSYDSVEEETTGEALDVEKT